MVDNQSKAVTAEDVSAAAKRIREIVDASPVVRSPELSRLVGVDVWLKLENLQPPGSFKIRGAANKLLAMSSDQLRRGVVTSSGGNHGAAVAYIAGLLRIPATVCVPSNVDPVKLATIRRFGAEAVVQGATFDEAVEVSHRLERERELAYVHPFDDRDVIAGQGTIALELLEQVPGLAAVAAAVSGGGLSGGIGVALAGRGPKVLVVGVSAEHAQTMVASLAAGHPIDIPYRNSLAEVLTGGIGSANQWSFGAVRDHVDRHVLVSEGEIGAGMRFALERHRIVVEGGGAVPIAAALAGKLTASATNGWTGLDGPLALVVSGGNVDPEVVLRLRG